MLFWLKIFVFENVNYQKLKKTPTLKQKEWEQSTVGAGT